MNIDVELNRVNTTAARASVLAPVFALALFTSAALVNRANAKTGANAVARAAVVLTRSSSTSMFI